jgi:hypothetical protein
MEKGERRGRKREEKMGADGAGRGEEDSYHYCIKCNKFHLKLLLALLMQLPCGTVHIHTTPQVRDTGRSLHGAGLGATDDPEINSVST